MSKILLFPSYLGGGFGHIGRCLALADAWARRGGQAAFALDGPHLKRVAEAGYETYVITTPRMPKPSPHPAAYVYFTGMAYQIVRDGFDHPRIVERALAEALRIVHRVRPDVLVGDGWPIAWLVAHQAGIPLVQLVKSVAHPRPERLAWWEEPPADMISPDPGPVFNPVLDRIGLPVITCAEELLSGDLLILPSVPPLDPMTSLPSNTHYVGPIIRQSVTLAKVPAWFSFLDETRPLVYVTIGGAAGSSGSVEFFQLVADALGNGDYQVIVSTGDKVDPHSVGTMPSNIRLERWVPGSQMIARSDVVVFHGGYTRMEILMKGLPSVVIPFHSEQEHYGRLMTKAGVAIVVPYSDEPYHRFLHRWRGGSRWKSKRYTVHVRLKPTLQPQMLRLAVERSLSDAVMRSKVQALGALLETFGGCEQVLDLIEAQVNLGIF